MTNFGYVLVTYSTKLLFFARKSLFFGADTKNRTRDLLITNQLLYHLSYAGISGSLIKIFYLIKRRFVFLFLWVIDFSTLQETDPAFSSTVCALSR